MLPHMSLLNSRIKELEARLDSSDAEVTYLREQVGVLKSETET